LRVALSESETYEAGPEAAAEEGGPSSAEAVPSLPAAAADKTATGLTWPVFPLVDRLNAVLTSGGARRRRQERPGRREGAMGREGGDAQRRGERQLSKVAIERSGRGL
jgi:hypothetical protein